MKPVVDVNVVICTRNRASFLKRTLTDLWAQELGGITMEVIVVDNGSDDQTAEILRSQPTTFRQTVLFEPVPGKARSLNRAIRCLTGRLILFTDDDVSLGTRWVNSYVQAAEKFKQCALFCGPIIPEFPPDTPEWLKNHQWNTPFFGAFGEQHPEGPLSDHLLPLGGNMAVRAKAILGTQFRLDLGPSDSNGKLLGEDIDFAQRIRDRSRSCIHVPSASVLHFVRPEQLTREWLCERAFSLGKSIIRLDRPVTIVSDFRFDVRAVDHEGLQLDQACLIHYYFGQLAAAYENKPNIVRLLRDAIQGLDVAQYAHILTPDAHALLNSL